MADGGVPGVEDVARLGGWLADNGIPAGDGPGRSPLILRRPPLGHVLPTAHDMAREYRVITALNGTAVPVPPPVALCPDPSVVGAPFYLMDYVDGAVLRTSEDAGVLAPGQAGLLSQRVVDMLARIHGLDVGSVGLAGFGKPEGYLDRQLARWQRQWELSATREMPGYDDLTRRLADGLPAVSAAAPPGGAGAAATTEQGRRPGTGGGLVHGDYRLDNMLIAGGEEPRILAVVDWEMSTLGDPLADLGLSLVYWTEAGEEDLLRHAMGDSVMSSA